MFDQSVDFTAERSRGKSVNEGDAVLCGELLRRGIEPDGTTASAERIVAPFSRRA